MPNDSSTIHFPPDATPEAVALALFDAIARVEGKTLLARSGTDRKWILDTYRECLDAIRSNPAPSP